MIYKKDANFPYPVLANTSSSYVDNYFVLEVQLFENVDHYRFEFNYEIDSEFIKRLIHDDKAQLILVIQSKDNKFYKLNNNKKSVKISKTRISVSERTSIQLHIQAKEDISFKNNEDLSEFYDSFKEDIDVPKHSILGYSNVVIFDSIKKPYSLFEKKVDPNLKSDINIELGSEMIIIHYKKEEYQFNDLPHSNALNNPYVYTGLYKALQRFIINNGEDGEYVDLATIDEPENALDLKLYTLMKKKMITELSIDTIDEVIYAISNRILEKYTDAVRRLSEIGN